MYQRKPLIRVQGADQVDVNVRRRRSCWPILLLVLITAALAIAITALFLPLSSNGLVQVNSDGTIAINEDWDQISQINCGFCNNSIPTTSGMLTSTGTTLSTGMTSSTSAPMSDCLNRLDGDMSSRVCVQLNDTTTIESAGELRFRVDSDGSLDGGDSTSATGQGAIALGDGVVAQGPGAVALGVSEEPNLGPPCDYFTSSASVPGTAAAGSTVLNSGGAAAEGSLASGPGARVDTAARGSQAIGRCASVHAEFATAIGSGILEVESTGCIIPLDFLQTTDAEITGPQVGPGGRLSVSLGSCALSDAPSCFAAGNGVGCLGTNSAVIGLDSQTFGQDTVSIGRLNRIDTGATAASVIGNANQVRSTAFVLGASNVVELNSGDTVVLGRDHEVNESGVTAIGLATESNIPDIIVSKAPNAPQNYATGFSTSLTSGNSGTTSFPFPDFNVHNGVVATITVWGYCVSGAAPFAPPLAPGGDAMWERYEVFLWATQAGDQLAIFELLESSPANFRRGIFTTNIAVSTPIVGSTFISWTITSALSAGTTCEIRADFKAAE